MSKRDKTTKQVSRRDTLKVCLVPAGALAARWLSGCGDSPRTDDEQQPITGDAGGSSGGSDAGTQAPLDAGLQPNPVTDAGSQPRPDAGGTGPQPSDAGGVSGNADAGASPPTDAGTSASPDAATTITDGGGVAGPGVPWATGGTKTMLGPYPDPFGAGAGTMCKLYPTQTLGPCYVTSPSRKDASAGMDGLPVRLSFLVVRASGCMAVANATVDIWHSGSGGIYSAFRTNSTCNPSTQDVMSQDFGRGVQSVGPDGRVDFDTIFPGWYSGRAVHIHFTVRVGSTAAVTSQLYFDDALTNDIFAQGLYKARGPSTTTNASDSTFKSGNATPEQVLFATAKRPDGVLHAWKVLSIG